MLPRGTADVPATDPADGGSGGDLNGRLRLSSCEEAAELPPSATAKRWCSRSTRGSACSILVRHCVRQICPMSDRQQSGGAAAPPRGLPARYLSDTVSQNF